MNNSEERINVISGQITSQKHVLGKEKSSLIPFILCPGDLPMVRVGWLIIVNWKSFLLLVMTLVTISKTKITPVSAGNHAATKVQLQNMV